MTMRLFCAEMKLFAFLIRITDIELIRIKTAEFLPEKGRKL